MPKCDGEKEVLNVVIMWLKEIDEDKRYVNSKFRESRDEERQLS